MDNTNWKKEFEQMHVNQGWVKSPRQVEEFIETLLFNKERELVEDLRELRHADYEMAMENFIAKYSHSQE